MGCCWVYIKLKKQTNLPLLYLMWILKHTHYFFHCTQQTIKCEATQRTGQQRKKSLLSANFRDSKMLMLRSFYRTKGVGVKRKYFGDTCPNTKLSYVFTVNILHRVCAALLNMSYTGKWYKQALLFLLNIAF